jgi:hypothetical protein
LFKQFILFVIKFYIKNNECFLNFSALQQLPNVEKGQDQGLKNGTDRYNGIFSETERNETKRKIFEKMDGWIVSGGVALLHAGHKTGLMCTTVLSLMSQSLILYSSWVHGRNNFCVACIWLRKFEVTERLIVVF